MANADWRTDQLIASIKRRANISTSDDGWSMSDMLAMATDEMRDSIVPMLRRLNEEYLIDDYDVAVVAGTASYRLPSWATGEALRDVQLPDGNGGFYSLIRKEPQSVSSLVTGPSGLFFLKDESVVLVPTPTAATTLRMRCLRRPARLVLPGVAFVVTNIGASYLDTLPVDAAVTVSGFGYFGAAATVDVVRGAPGFRPLGTELAAGLNGSPFENRFNLTVPSDAASGDYILLSGTSPVPQIPAELHPLLAQATSCAFLRASGQPGLETAEAKRVAMEAEAMQLFAPRTQNQQRYINNRSGVVTSPYGPRLLGRWRP